MVARRQQLCVAEILSHSLSHSSPLPCLGTVAFTSHVYHAWVHVNCARDHLFKWTQAQSVKHARAWNACVHTNQMNWILGSSVLGSGPGPLVWNHPKNHTSSVISLHKVQWFSHIALTSNITSLLNSLCMITDRCRVTRQLVPYPTHCIVGLLTENHWNAIKFIIFVPLGEFSVMHKINK